MKKYLIYILLAFIALPFVACTDDDNNGVETENVEREFMTMFRKDHNTNKGDDEPYACGVKNLNDIQLYWYGVHGCAGYQIRCALQPNAAGGEAAWEESAANGLLVFDITVGPEVLELLVKDLEYSTSYRFAIRTLSKKGEGYHSKWYGYGDGRQWADWAGWDTGERYPTPEVLRANQITKNSFRVSIERAKADAALGVATEEVESWSENFELDADENFVMHYLTITPSPTNPTAKIDPKWAHYDLTEEDFARGYVEVDGLDENSVYVVKAVNKNNPILVDAVYNTLTPRTDGTPGDPILLAHDQYYIPNDSVPGANDYQAARLDEWLVDYTQNNTLAEGTIFYLEGGKSYYFHQNPTLCKGFTMATNPEDIAAGKPKAKLFLGGTTIVGNAPNSCNFMFGRQPQAGEDGTISVKSLIFENIHFDCPTATNFGDAKAIGNYFANMYSNGMAVNFSAFEVRNCVFERMVRGFIRTQGSKRKVFENIIIEGCTFVNCGFYDNNGRGYAWIADDSALAKQNVYTNFVFRNNTMYDSPRDNFLTNNNKSLAWPETVKYNVVIENNTFVNFSTRAKTRNLINMRYVPNGSSFTVRNNLFISTRAAGDDRTLTQGGFDIRGVNVLGEGTVPTIRFDIENNYCATVETDKQKDDGIFNAGAFSATKNSAGTYLNYLAPDGGPAIVHGKENLVVKHVRSAAGDILDPTQIFVNPNPPHKNGHPDMHERELNDMLEGMKFQKTAEVTGAEFYQKRVGDPRWY